MRLLEAEDRVGATVVPLQAVYRIALEFGADDESSRHRVAAAVRETLGTDALSDEFEITFGGTSLGPELLDQAHKSILVYAV